MAKPSKFVVLIYHLNTGQHITLFVYVFISLSLPSGDPLYHSDNFHVCLLKVSEVLCQSWPTQFFYWFSLTSTMTTTGSLFFSFQLPGLCGSGAYVFPQTNVTVKESWMKWRQLDKTEVFRGRANRQRHTPPF